jgi:hypothetical protein
VACPTSNAASGALCEFADGVCLPKGTRTVLINGVPTSESSRANQCFDNRFQNGDLDFDGLDYVPDAWPNGSPNHPTSFEYLGPFQINGRPYPQVQYETDVGGSSILCNTTTGANCTVPPLGAKFYPFWSLGLLNGQLGNRTAACVWNFGDDQPNTILDFGKDAQYGTPDVARYAGTIISRPMLNPQFTGRCAA